MKRLTFLILCISLCLASSCLKSSQKPSHIYENHLQENQARKKRNSFALDKKTQKQFDKRSTKANSKNKNKTHIELLWIVPKEPVDGFIIRYGSDEKSLTERKRISADELEIVNNKTHGRVYRYLLQDIKNAKNIYVSIGAFKGDTFSKPTEVKKVN